MKSKLLNNRLFSNDSNSQPLLEKLPKAKDVCPPKFHQDLVDAENKVKSELLQSYIHS